MKLLIVNFHYIRNSIPKSGIYPRSLKEFKEQIITLGRHFDFVSEIDIYRAITRKDLFFGNKCLITLDDGLKEQMQAYEILKQLSVPAIFYVTADPLLNGKIHDVHKTHQIYANFSEDELYRILDKEHQISHFDFNTEILNNEYRYDSLIKKQIKYYINFILTNEQRQDFVNKRFKEVKSTNDFIKSFYMNKAEIKELGNSNMLGTHCTSHRPLAKLNDQEIKNEIKQSKKYLENISNSTIHSISYPFGGLASFNKKVIKHAKDEGLVFGLTMIRGFNQEEQIINNSFELLRVDTNDAPGGKFKSTEYVP